MKVYLIAGNWGETLKDIFEGIEDTEIIRKDKNICDVINFLDINDVDFDYLILFDQGIGTSIEDFRKELLEIHNLIKLKKINFGIEFITKNSEYKKLFDDIFNHNPSYSSYYVDGVKVPISLLHTICENQKIQKSKKETTKWSLFNKSTNHISRTKRKTHEYKKLLNIKRNEILDLGKSVSRVIAITGDRNSGITSTVANLAIEASNYGLKTLIIDLDIKFRGLNLYFSKFGEEADINSDLQYSLVKAITNPDDLITNSCQIDDNLSILTLAYSVKNTDKRLEKINSNSILQFISLIKNKFNLVLLDFPLSSLSDYYPILVSVDKIALCITNSLHSVFNTSKELEGYIIQNQSNLKYKTQFILTKSNKFNLYRNKIFEKNSVLETMNLLTNNFFKEAEIIGEIPYKSDFDVQIDTGKKICTVDDRFKEIYLDLLANLFEQSYH